MTKDISSATSILSPVQLYEINSLDYNENNLQLPPFLRLLRLSSFVMRMCGFFPLESKKLHIKNLFSASVIVFIGGMNLYVLLFNGLPALSEMFSSWSIFVAVTFGICLFFGLTFCCLVFVVRLGYDRKLERLSELMSHATNQRGLEIKFRQIAMTVHLLQIVIISAALLKFIIYVCFCTIERISQLIPNAAITYKNILGKSWLAHVITMLGIAPSYTVLFQSVFFYWISCKCVRAEFEQVNRDITECDLRKLYLFKAIQTRHCRLLKCLEYLHEMVAFYVMCVFAVGSLLSTLFAYVILLGETDTGFRLLAFYWLCLTAGVICVLCLSAHELHRAVS